MFSLSWCGTEWEQSDDRLCEWGGGGEVLCDEGVW